MNPDSLGTSYLDRLNNAVAPATKAGLQVAYGAGAGEIGQTTSDTTSEVIGLGCALMLLLFMFGSLVTAAIPLVAAIFSVGAGLALLALLASVVTFPTTAPTIATLLGLGVAVDYGLFLVSRHREQLDSGMDVLTSVRRPRERPAPPSSWPAAPWWSRSWACTSPDVCFVGALGLAAALVVVVTMIAALTMVPALMGLVKGNVRALTDRIRARSGPDRAGAGRGDRRGHRGAARAQRVRPLGPDGQRPPLAVGRGQRLVLVVLAIPLFSITLGQPDNGTNPTSQCNRQAYDLITQGFGVGVNGPLTVVVTLPDQSSSATSSLLSAMQTNIAKTAGVASVGPARSQLGRQHRGVQRHPDHPAAGPATTGLVTTLRDTVLPKSHVTSYVTGTTAGSVDFTSRITSRLPWLILAVVAISFLLLTTAFRSVVIATKAAVLNLLSIGAAYGVIVAIFQWGWARADRPADHPAHPGLRADAGVLHRVRPVHGLRGVPAVADPRGLDPTGDPHRAVAIGIGATARVITTAAAIMVVVFASFVLNTDPTVKMLAIGMAFAVLIDATLVRMCLVPSIMSLLGSHAWWMPRWMEPVVPHLHLEGSAAEQTAPEPALASASRHPAEPPPGSP